MTAQAGASQRETSGFSYLERHNQCPLLGPDELSMAEVLVKLDKDDNLSAARRRDLRSAVRRYAELVNRDPVNLRAHARDIAQRFRHINMIFVRHR